MRAAFGKATGIEGNDTVGFPQAIGHLSNQHRQQWPMVPWHDTDEVLDDLSPHIDQGRNFFSILAWQVGQQPLEIEVHGVADLGPKRLLVGYDELGETIHHLMEDVRGDETIAQQFLSPLCPYGCHLFASSPWPVDTVCCQEAIVITIRYVIQARSEEEIQ
jgi:hypothetical protein